MLKLQEPDWSLHLENRLITFATYKQTDFCSTVSLGGNAQYSKVKTPSCFSIRCSTHFHSIVLLMLSTVQETFISRTSYPSPGCRA